MDTLTDDMTVEEAEALLTASEPEEPEIPAADPEAPFGRFANGKPRKSAPKQSRARKQAPPAPEKRKPKAATGGYAGKAGELLALPQGVLTLVAAARQSEPLLADAVTLEKYGPTLAQVTGRIAEENSGFAAVLDRLTGGATLYGELMIVVLPIVLQLGVNHGRIKPVESLGVVSRETLLAGVAQP